MSNLEDLNKIIYYLKEYKDIIEWRNCDARNSIGMYLGPPEDNSTLKDVQQLINRLRYKDDE